MAARRIVMACGAAALALIMAPVASAGSHLWDVIEVFSNQDGSIQFIELKEMGGAANETFLAGKKITSTSTGKSFTFPNNLVPPTSNKHLLLATQSFASLPGAPTPNYIIPPNFFNPNGDTLKYHVYDTWTFGAIPKNCVSSFNRSGGAMVNSPQNYAGTVGSVNCAPPPPPPPCPADLVETGEVDVDDLLMVINSWGSCGGCLADLVPAGPPKGNGEVDVDDLLEVINNWGPCR